MKEEDFPAIKELTMRKKVRHFLEFNLNVKEAKREWISL